MSGAERQLDEFGEDAELHPRVRAAIDRANAAEARDRAADARDAAAARERPQPGHRHLSETIAAAHRLAARDRERAAEDRRAAAADRRATLADLRSVAAALARSETDPLTGARTRAAGLDDLAHELERCRRTLTPLTVVYLDVVGLKALNDTVSHAAGDALLTDVVANLRAHLRPYDLIVRVGGDEFLCALPGLKSAEARARFAQFTSDSGAAPAPSRVRSGFAALRSGDTVAALIGRADTELTGARLRTREEVAPGAHPAAVRRVDLWALLDAVDEFGSASIELLAWEFSVSEDELRGHWDLAITEGLMTSSGVDAVVGEAMYALTPMGRRRLDQFRAGS